MYSIGHTGVSNKIETSRSNFTYCGVLTITLQIYLTSNNILTSSKTFLSKMKELDSYMHSIP